MCNKGKYKGKCNVTACTTNTPAVYLNHSTLAHYCETCANRLNNDVHNKKYAQENFGHDLCTLVKDSVERQQTLQELGKLGADILKQRETKLVADGHQNEGIFTFTTDCLLGIVSYKLPEEHNVPTNHFEIFTVVDAVIKALEEEYVLSNRPMSMEAMGALGIGYIATKK